MEILSPEKIVESFKSALGDGLLSSRIHQQEVAITRNLFQAIWLSVTPGSFKKSVAHFSSLQDYPHLAVVSSSDLGEEIELIYHFSIYYEYQFKEISVGVRVVLPKSKPEIPTITDIIPGALFTERETQEMIGIKVIGIPDDRRLFLSDDFPIGVYPWRKDDTGPQDLLKTLPGQKVPGR